MRLLLEKGASARDDEAHDGFTALELGDSLYEVGEEAKRLDAVRLVLREYEANCDAEQE